MDKTITAFVGLGVMGGPMAAHLVHAGRTVIAATHTPGKAEAWSRKTGGQYRAQALDAVAAADTVITMVRHDHDLETLFFGAGGLLEAIRPGTLVVDHTTASPKMARRLAAALNAKGVAFADAPVTGGQSGAERGALSAMVGCSIGDIDKVKVVASPYTAICERIGEVGAGQTAKLVNQVCIAGILQGLAEGLALGHEAGLDMDAVLRTISTGAAGSWQMENRARTMLAGSFAFGFSVDLLRKDLDLALVEGGLFDLDLPVARQVEGFLHQLQDQGYGRLDNSALILRLLQSLSNGASAPRTQAELHERSI